MVHGISRQILKWYMESVTKSGNVNKVLEFCLKQLLPKILGDVALKIVKEISSVGYSFPKYQLDDVQTWNKLKRNALLIFTSLIQCSCVSESDGKK
ncbi:UNVERIFIED_CONTAM: hypothetical protein NCL1_48109 [Trichonephila clavipes]